MNFGHRHRLFFFFYDIGMQLVVKSENVSCGFMMVVAK